MLIEQIIDFNWGAWTPWPNIHVYNRLFLWQIQSLRKIFEWIFIYCKNVAGDKAPYFPLPGPNHLQLKFN